MLRCCVTTPATQDDLLRQVNQKLDEVNQKLNELSHKLDALATAMGLLAQQIASGPRPFQ